MISTDYFGRVYFLRIECGSCSRCGQPDPSIPVRAFVGTGTISAWEVSPSQAVAIISYGDFDVVRLLPENLWLTREEADAVLTKESPDAR